MAAASPVGGWDILRIQLSKSGFGAQQKADALIKPKWTHFSREFHLPFYQSIGTNIKLCREFILARLNENVNRKFKIFLSILKHSCILSNNAINANKTLELSERQIRRFLCLNIASL